MRLLQASCGLLAAASLVALGRPGPEIVAHDGAVTIASAHPAVPTEWSGSGPLAIPTIGVVPAGAEDWFDPTAEPTFRARPPLPSAASLPSVTETAAPDSEQPSPERSSPAEPPADTPPASTTEDPISSSSTPTTTAQTTTAPGTTTPTTIAPMATTPTTTAPGTTAPETTASATTASPSTTTPEPSQTTTPTRPSPQTNERGNVVLAFGDELTVYDGETDAVAFAIAVGRIDADVVCADPANPAPTNGSLVAVHVRVTTGPDLSAVGEEPAVRAADFRVVVGSDGATLVDAGTPSAATCVPDGDLFPDGPLTAGQELTGVVVLDVPAMTGTLVFAPDFLPVGAEWNYGPPAAE